MKQDRHSGNRRKKGLLHLRKQKVTRIRFAEECGIKTVTMSFWFDMEKFGAVVWNKLEPALRKYNINPAYVQGTSDKMVLSEEPILTEREWQQDLMSLLKEMNGLLREILQEVKKPDAQ